MYDKAVSTDPSIIKCVPKCHKTQKMYNKAVNRCFFVFDSVPDWYKTQEMCDGVVFENTFLIV